MGLQKSAGKLAWFTFHLSGFLRRGHGYAAKACELLRPAAKAHGMKVLGITNNPANAASCRVCEKLGARFIGKAALPEYHSMYSETRHDSNIFFWDVEPLT